jgi:hypothetical protein
MSRRLRRRMLRHMNTPTNIVIHPNYSQRPAPRPKRGGGRRWDKRYSWIDSPYKAALMGTIGRPFA